MLQKITLACLLVASVYGAGEWNPDLRTTFGLNPFGIGSSQFIPKAKNIDEAISMKWVRRTRPAGPAGLESLELWCPADDCSFCSLFDDTGYIAGVQIGVSKSRMSDWVFDPAVTGFTSWTTTINGQTAEFYTIQLYFISAEILATKKEDRLASRNKKLLIQHGYVWMTAFNGELHALSTDTSLLGTSQSEFTTQACVPWMGQHYYHKMSKTTQCTGETLFPWFPLMDSDQLIGLGFMTFGKYTVDSNVQDLFEHPDESAVKMIVNDGPQCLYDLTRTRGVLTMHVYFIDTPQLVGCSIFGLWEPNIKARFGLSPFEDSFVPMARNIDEAIEMKWVKRDRPAGPEGLESLELWCPADDCSFCTLLDDTGYPAGVQVGVAKSRVKEMKYDASVTGFTSWTTTINGAPAEFYTIALYFVSAEILKKSKESRIADREEGQMLHYGNIWMTGYNGQLYALPLDTSLLGTSQSDFTKQSCVPWMGQHYYYKMTKETTCSAETLFPWFPLVDSNQIIGLGFMSFIKYEVDKNVKDLFEHPSETAVKAIVSNGPECLYELARNYGVLTMHVYLIESPRKIGCLFG